MNRRQLLSRLPAIGLAIAAGALLTGQSRNWIGEIERGEVSHFIGNPAAGSTLTEFVSYTCSACGSFARMGEEIIKIGYVSTGRLRFEVRHIQRNEIDVALTMAAWCGGSAGFGQSHRAIMHSQDAWLAVAARPSPAQQTRWFTGPGPAKRRAILWDLEIYRLLEPLGVGRGELDACMADDRFAAALIASSGTDLAQYGISGTPSFALDGRTLPQVHDWATLAPVLAAIPSPPQADR